MKTKEKVFLKPETVYTYLLGGDDSLDTMIMTAEHVELSTSDQNLYAAVAAIEDRSKIDLNRLVKFIERVHIHSHEHIFKEKRSPLTHERASQIRKGE